MSEKKIKVPDGMLDAVNNTYGETCRPWEAWNIEDVLKAALSWLASNPIVPSDAQLGSLTKVWNSGKVNGDFMAYLCTEFQRIMFLAEEEVPEEIKDLLWKSNPYPNTGAENRHDEAVLEAFRRGQCQKGNGNI